MFKIKKKRKLISGNGKKIYQFKDGTYLPDSSQPSPLNPARYTPHESTRYTNVCLGSNGIAVRQKENGVVVEMNKELPELYASRKNCCGCTACYAVCPMSGPERPQIAYRDVEGNIGKSEQPYEIEYIFSGANYLSKLIEHTGAITMMPDEEGFLYPVVDAALCIRCHKCLDVCGCV